MNADHENLIIVYNQLAPLSIGPPSRDAIIIHGANSATALHFNNRTVCALLGEELAGSHIFEADPADSSEITTNISPKQRLVENEFLSLVL
jgi:hypothetical protein